MGVAIRWYVRHDVHRGPADTAWRLTYSIEGQADRGGARLQVALPADTQTCRVFRQDYEQANLRISPRGHGTSQGRQLTALAEAEGTCESTFRFDLHLNPQAHWSANGAKVTLSTRQRREYLAAQPLVQADDPIVIEHLDQVRVGQTNQAAVVRAIFDDCHRGIVADDIDAADDAATVIQDRAGTFEGCARAMIALCRAAKIPVRPVVGFDIAQSGPIGPIVWVEVLLDNHWISYDPVNGYAGELPYSYVPVREGDDRIVLTSGVKDLETEFNLLQMPALTLGGASARQRPIDILDLTRLPLELQHVISLILLMPLGALITSVFRNIIGLKTSGTFTPTLLALSFVFADWRTGLIILAVALTLGIVTRYLLHHLELLMVPRLSIMLTLVVLCIVFGISALQYYQVAPGAATVLLPMVILTMLVERFYLTTQEDGVSVAVQHLFGSAVVGFCCYLVLCWETVAQLLLAYPEAHFFTVAVLVLIGRYTGYQWTEPWRFRDFVAISKPA